MQQAQPALEDRCVICISATAEVTLEHGVTRHTCICRECYFNGGHALVNCPLCRAEVSEAHEAGQTLPHPSLLVPPPMQQDQPAPNSAHPLASLSMAMMAALPPFHLIPTYVITTHEASHLMEVAQQLNTQHPTTYPLISPNLLRIIFSIADSEPVTPLPPIMPNRSDIPARLHFLTANSFLLSNATGSEAWLAAHQFLATQLQPFQQQQQQQQQQQGQQQQQQHQQRPRRPRQCQQRPPNLPSISDTNETSSPRSRSASPPAQRLRYSGTTPPRPSRSAPLPPSSPLSTGSSPPHSMSPRPGGASPARTR